MIRINSNGSKWLGQEPDSIEDLFAVLAEYMLNPMFEDYGNFIMALYPKLPSQKGVVRFWGNFLTVSHVFSIDTDEPELIENLTKAIRLNQERPDYRKFIEDKEKAKQTEIKEKTLITFS